MEQISIIWTQWVAPIFGGLSLTAIATAVIYGLVRGFITKLTKKINIEKIEEKAVDKGVEKIKEITFQHDIMPLVESKLKSINEVALNDVKELISNYNKQYSYLINILKQFSSYFDDSISISADKKIELQKLVADAETMIIVDTEPVISKVLVEESNKKNESKTKIVR